MKTFSIRNATISHQDPAVATLVLAFSSDPAARWLYRDPHQYLTYFPSFVQAFAGKAFEHQSAYYVDGFVGTALWLPPEIHPDEDSVLSLLRETVAGGDRGEVFAVLEQMNRCHPAEPHWYLPMIGVIPEKQGEGYGSALLKHTLERCDADGKLAYLESSSPKNIPLYQRHGFELIGTIQVGSSPTLFPMVRKPALAPSKEAQDDSLVPEVVGSAG